MKHFQHILVGWLVDGSGGPVRRHVLMSWEEDTLISLKGAEPKTLEASNITDLRNFTVLPGLVDAHVHLSMSGEDDPEQRKRQVNFTFGQARSAISHHITRHIARGVVALRDGGDRAGHVLLYKKRLLGGTPRLPLALKVSGQSWHAPGRYGKFIGRTLRPGETLAAAMTGVWTGGDHIKLVNSGLTSLIRFGEETASQFGLKDLETAVKQAHALGLKVMVHANGRVPVARAVEAGCDSVEHGFFMGRENLEKMAERGTTWVPTVFTMGAIAENPGKDNAQSDVAKRNLEHQLDQIRLARGLGVPIAAGTDSGSLGVNHGEAISEELRLMTAAGLTFEEAVRCASSRGAALLDIEEHTGLLAPGRPATFVAVKAPPGDVLDHLKGPCMVVVKGKLLDTDSRSIYRKIAACTDGG